MPWQGAGCHDLLQSAARRPDRRCPGRAGKDAKATAQKAAKAVKKGAWKKERKPRYTVTFHRPKTLKHARAPKYPKQRRAPDAAGLTRREAALSVDCCPVARDACERAGAAAAARRAAGAGRALAGAAQGEAARGQRSSLHAAGLGCPSSTSGMLLRQALAGRAGPIYKYPCQPARAPSRAIVAVGAGGIELGLVAVGDRRRRPRAAP